MDLDIKPTPSTSFHTANQLFDWVRQDAAVQFAAAAARQQALETVEDARRYQQEKRALFRELLGGLPEERTNLQPVVTGVLQRDGYRIEKVIFQSHPGFHVTALLYVPGRLPQERNPAVLLLCGHTGLSKAYPVYQRVSLELVRAGLVVLAMDPVGQGERQQYFVSDSGYGRLSAGVPEHTHVGLQCALAGANVARYFVWDMIRALDYLVSLPFVDPARIGATGNSGGGTQTSYLMLADDRLAAAVPCGYLNDRQLYLASGQAHDAEQNIFGAISSGIGYDDFLIGFAPKPVLVGAARFDFFHLKGTDACVESARRVYRLFGKESVCELAIADAEHSYSATLRKAATDFFLRHLCGSPGNHPGFPDNELPVEPVATLACCKTKNVRAEFADERTVFQMNRDYLAAHARRHVPKPEDVARVLGIADLLPLRPRSVYRIESHGPGDADLYEWNGLIRKRVEFFAEDRIYLNGLYLQERRTEGHKPPLCLILPEEGLADGPRVNDLVLRLVWGGHAVFITDTRGVGVSESVPINPNPRRAPYGTEFRLAYDCLMLGRSLLGLRVFDVLRAVDCLTKMGGDVNTGQLSVHGLGLGALYALFAAALEPRIQGGVLENMIPSFAAIVDTELYSLPCPERLIVNGILRQFDVPGLLKAVAPRRFELMNPVTVG